VAASVRKSSKTSCDEPVVEDRSWIATSRLSRHIHMLDAAWEPRCFIAAFSPKRAAIASASKTSLLGPRGNEPRKRQRQQGLGGSRSPVAKP
jgi:hypothetical protein